MPPINFYERMICCWRCGKRGHRRSRCRGIAKEFCSYCGKLGRLSRNCSCRYQREPHLIQRRRESQLNLPQGILTPVPTNESRVLVSLLIYGRTFTALLDTGSKRSYLRKDVADWCIQQKFHINTIYEQNASIADDMVPFDREINLVANIDGKQIRLTCLIMENLDQEVLLGTDVLGSLKASLTFRERHSKVCLEEPPNELDSPASPEMTTAIEHYNPTSLGGLEIKEYYESDFLATPEELMTNETENLTSVEEPITFEQESPRTPAKKCGNSESSELAIKSEPVNLVLSEEPTIDESYNPVPLERFSVDYSPRSPFLEEVHMRINESTGPEVSSTDPQTRPALAMTVVAGKFEEVPQMTTEARTSSTFKEIPALTARAGTSLTFEESLGQPSSSTACSRDSDTPADSTEQQKQIFYQNPRQPNEYIFDVRNLTPHSRIKIQIPGFNWCHFLHC